MPSTDAEATSNRRAGRVQHDGNVPMGETSSVEPCEPTSTAGPVAVARGEAPAHTRLGEVLEAIALGAGRFLHAREWEQPIADVLDRLGRAAAVSRVYVFEAHLAADGSRLVSQRYEWAAPGIAPQIDDPTLQDFSLAGNGLCRFEEALASGEIVHHHTRELSSEQRPALEAQEILSILLVPVHVDGEWWGFVGFDDCTRERRWTSSEIDALKAFGDILGGAIGRQRLESRFAEAEAKYRALVEQLPAVAYLGEYGPDGDWLYVSPQIEGVLGYTTEEWLAHPSPMTSCTHQDDLPAVREAEERSLRTGEDYRATSRMRTKDGRWVWILDEARPVRGADGQILFMQGTMTDVTARREEEESRVRLQSALESERRIREAMDDIHLACVSMDLEGRVTYCNRFLLQLAGRSAEEVLGQGWWDRFSPDVPLEERARFLKDVRTGPAIGVRDAPVRTRTGEDRRISWSDTVVRDAAGEVVGVTSIGQDVTDQHAAEQQLLASERRFRTLTENGHDVITLVGPDGTILHSSPNDERVLGYSSDQTLGSNAMDYVHPDDLEVLGKLFAGLVEDPDGGSRAEFRVRHGNGSWIWVETVAQNRLEDTAVRAIVLNTRDITERRLAEEELRRTERKYRTVVEGLPGIVYMDPPLMDRPTLYVSPQVEEVLGYPPEHFTSDVNAWYEIIHPDDIRAEITEELTAFEQSRPTQIEYRIRTRDGRVVWVADHSEPITDEKGEIVYWLGVMLDVTERKAAEDRLREADARYRMLVESMPAVSYIEPPGEDPDLFYMSPQITNLLGYDPEDFRDPDFWDDHIHPEDRERVVAEDKRVTASHERFLWEYRMIAADGSIVWIRDEAVLLDGGDAIPSFWQGFLIDITARKRAEGRLREAEAKYRTLVEHVPAIVYADTDTPIGVTTYLSPQVEVMLGYAAEEFIRSPDLWSRVIHPDDLERQQAAELRSFETKAPFSIEYRCVARDGRIVWVEDRSAPVRDEEGQILFWQGVMVDITKLKQAEQELTRALEMEREVTRRLRNVDDMKDSFLTAVSHELRTPLTSVVGSAITLETLDGSLPPDDRRALLAGISTGAKKLDRLVRDLLDTDRLSRGVLSPQRRPADLADVADRVIEESGLRSSREIVRDLGGIVASVDVAMVERILENLLVNADKHTPADARIWIRAVRQEGGLLLVVEDDGPGVPEPERAQIFEPFVRGTNGVDHAPGVGVGLSLVARFAQLHGGRAWLEDRAGGGASFHVFLADDGQAAVAGQP